MFLLDIDASKYSSLSESYYGGNDHLDEIDLCFKRIIFITKGQDSGNRQEKKIYVEIDKIKEHLKKLFNFEEVSIVWVKQDIAANAMTYPIMLANPLEFDFEVEETSNGVRWKRAEGKTLMVTMYSSLITVSGMTERELTCTLLHEIGHNFYVKSLLHIMIGKIIAAYFFIMAFIPITPNPLNPNDAITQRIMLVLARLDKTFMSFGGHSASSVSSTIRDFIGYRDTFESIFSIALTAVAPFLGRVLASKEIMGLIKNPTPIEVVGVINSLVYGYDNEKYADNFATTYGYGKELATTQLKFNTKATVLSKTYKDNPTLAIYNDFFFMLTWILKYIIDPHPEGAFRIYDQATLLEKELEKNKNIPPKSRARMLEDIKFIRARYGEIEQAYKSNNQEFSAFVIKINKAIFNGDPRELIAKTSNYDVVKVNTSDGIIGNINSALRDAFIQLCKVLDYTIPDFLKRFIGRV